MTEKKQNFVSATLVGIGQIMLQDSGWTGLLFLLGMLWNDIPTGIAFAVGAMVSTMTAKLLKYEAANIRFGLYGFNGALVGAASIFLFGPTEAAIWIALILGATLSTIIMHVFIAKKLVAFTFPFVLVTWIIFYLFHATGWLPTINHPLPVIDSDMLHSAEEPLFGFAEVNFAGSAVTGILFIIGVYLCSPIAAIYGFVGAIISAVCCAYIHEDGQVVANGIFSFSAVLCAITFSGTKKRDGIFALVAILLAVLIQIGMIKINVPAFTFPFIVASWIVLYIKNKINECAKFNEHEQCRTNFFRCFN